MPNAGTARSGGEQSFNQTSSTKFAEASPEEKALIEQFSNLGAGQAGLIQDLVDRARTGSMFQLSPQDALELDKAYNAANQQLEVGARDYADTLAGGRGMRMSDTPIAQQAIERYGLGKAQIASDRALQGLNLGLQGNIAKAGLTSLLPAASGAAFQPLFSERMASGTTTTSGTGQNQGFYQQPLMQTILQGTQAFNQAGQGLSNFFGGLGAGKSFLGLGSSTPKLPEF